MSNERLRSQIAVAGLSTSDLARRADLGAYHRWVHR